MARKKTHGSDTETAKPDPLVGRTVVSVRKMTAAELRAEGWEGGRHGAPPVVVLDDTSKIYPSRDDEGNGPGALFGVDKDGKSFRVG